MEGISTAKISLFHKGSMEIHRHENRVIVPPVNNKMSDVMASWATQLTTHACLDNINTI